MSVCFASLVVSPISLQESKEEEEARRLRQEMRINETRMKISNEQER